ncbi:hypothetical protein [Flavobacterium ginsengiterrae]|uniref:Uncharacterized protein n=1 Tax=Flavobacterium ginsengiterrae TaxID=871695 RepID=A0ABP7H7C2_9FLAO
MYRIILCEKATGIVLELDGKTRFSNNDTNSPLPSMTFNTIEEAEDMAAALIKENSTLEIGIYKNDETFVKRY